MKEGDGMTMWEYYRREIRSKDPIDAFYIDAMEFRQSVVYVYDILNRKTPVSGTIHNWNAARTAMSIEMDDFEKAFFRFMRRKTERNAEAFGLMWTRIDKPLQMARNAIFCSECRRNWNRNKGKYSEWIADGKKEGKV